MSMSFEQLHQIVIFPAKPVTRFNFNKCSNDHYFYGILQLHSAAYVLLLKYDFYAGLLLVIDFYIAVLVLLLK